MTVKILQGDCIAVMKTLPAESFDCVVTSPPYWGLRDYGVDGQMGLEKNLGGHISKMVEVFAEVHRVLKPSGTVWMNYGDCYASTPNGRKADDVKALGNDDRTFRDKPFSTVGAIYSGSHDIFPTGKKGRRGGGNNSAGGYLKPKDLCMIPNRVAIALQEYGWWVRSEIIWGKPNAMPESVTDRPATAHEKVFLLTKSARYFYDAQAVRQKAADSSVSRWAQDIDSQQGSSRANGGRKTNGTMKAVGGPRSEKQRGHSRRHDGFNDRWDQMPRDEQTENGRHLKNYEPAPVQVWRIATKPCRLAHFATFPPELVDRCLTAGCPKGGSVLDPFGGAGTTGIVADALGLDATLIELNEEYIGIARDRLRAGLVRVDCSQPEKSPVCGPLFAGEPA